MQSARNHKTIFIDLPEKLEVKRVDITCFPLRCLLFMFSRVCVYFSGVAIAYYLLFRHVVYPLGITGRL